MTPTTIDPPQPQGQGQYPLNALTPSFIKQFSNNGDYTQKTGKPAPAYNAALPIKRWVDTSVAGGTFQILAYSTAHLDPSGQKPIVSQIGIPGYLAGTVNMPPDSGPVPPSSAGEFLAPIRALLPNEKLIANPFGISVVNTDIYDPTVPQQSSGGGGGLTAAEHNMLFAIGAAMGILGA